MIAAIYNPSAAATSLFVDLICSPPELCYFERLREEVIEAVKADEDWLNPALLTKQSYTESAVRESLRHNAQMGHPSTREVISRDGVTIPGGSHLPQGTWVGFAVPSISLGREILSGTKQV